MEHVANSRAGLQEKNEQPQVRLRRKKALLGYRMGNMGANKDLTAFVKDDRRKDALKYRGSAQMQALSQGALDNFMEELGLDSSQFTKLTAAPKEARALPLSLSLWP